MTIAYFATFAGPTEAAQGFADRFREERGADLTALPGVRAVDLYAPEGSHDPYLDDGPGPLLIVHLDFDSVADLEAALATDGFARAIAVGDNLAAAGGAVTHDAFAAEAFPVAGETDPAPLTAPVSYVVRYYRPAENEKAFVDYYRTHHPPILGDFPGIRNVLLFTPVAWTDPAGIERADTMLGNEVVFDSIDALNAALASDVRHRLRDDYKTFPPFDGRVTHYAMRRTRLGA